MGKIRVDFERIHGAGVNFSSIKVNDALLPFVNHKAAALVDDDEAFELYWRIQGEPGAKLTIEYTIDGVTTPITDAIAAGRTHRSAFTFIQP